MHLWARFRINVSSLAYVAAVCPHCGVLEANQESLMTSSGAMEERVS